MRNTKESFTLEPVIQSDHELQDKMRDYLSEALDVKVSVGSFEAIFTGCFLPMERFRAWPEVELPDDLQREIMLWFFMRFMGRKPKLNIIGEFDAAEAKPFSEAIINATLTDDWKESLFNPLDCGYLPY